MCWFLVSDFSFSERKIKQALKFFYDSVSLSLDLVVTFSWIERYLDYSSALEFKWI